MSQGRKHEYAIIIATQLLSKLRKDAAMRSILYGVPHPGASPPAVITRGSGVGLRREPDRAVSRLRIVEICRCSQRPYGGRAPLLPQDHTYSCMIAGARFVPDTPGAVGLPAMPGHDKHCGAGEGRIARHNGGYVAIGLGPVLWLAPAQ
jgi:hypothetical protein